MMLDSVHSIHISAIYITSFNFFLSETDYEYDSDDDRDNI